MFLVRDYNCIGNYFVMIIEPYNKPNPIFQVFIAFTVNNMICYIESAVITKKGEGLLHLSGAHDDE